MRVLACSMLVTLAVSVSCGGSEDRPRPASGGTCLALAPAGNDPGSPPANCHALDGYEIRIIDDFETGAASGWYVNNDRSGLQDPAPDTDPVPAAPIPGGRCVGVTGAQSLFAIHIRSAPLGDYGGVFGRNMPRRSLNIPIEQCPIHACLDRAPPPPSVGPCGIGQGTPLQQTANTGACITGTDASQWDGIVFWARKGPGAPIAFDDGIITLSSSSTLRVQVSDQTTDDSNQACVCNPFTNQNDTSGSGACSASTAPKGGCSAGCDKFGTFVTVDNTFRAYFVPFDQMQQGGWGIKANGIDKSGLFSLAFSYGRGAWDLWIDDIAFYRRKP